VNSNTCLIVAVYAEGNVLILRTTVLSFSVL